MVKNRKLARAISLQGWREFLVLCEAKSDKFGREFRTISRWEPTSQICSDCGYRWGKLDLSIRSILCLNCGIEQNRDENASRTIEKVGIGHCHDSKRTQRDGKTTSVAPPSEASRITAAKAAVSMSKFPYLRRFVSGVRVRVSFSLRAHAPDLNLPITHPTY